MLKIPTGHREGPYLVIEKNNDKLICLYISSCAPSNKHFSNKIFELNNQNYFLDKNSFIHITKQAIISIERFIKKIDYLTKEDQKNLFKKYEIIHRKTPVSKKVENIPYIPLDAGDIISNKDEYYLIISEDNINYQCIKLIKNQPQLEFYIIIDKIKYYLDFDHIINYSKLLEPIRNNFINNKTLLNILEMQRQRLKYLNQKNNISRGSLIIINEIYYYIYGEIGNEWLAFSILDKQNEELCQIEIGQNKYYTDFSTELKISKKENNIELIDLATDTQIEKIKNIKKSHIKNLQKKNKKATQKQPILTKKEIQRGSIVKIINADKSHPYIVLTRNQDELITIMYDKHLEGKYYFQILYINQVEDISNIENSELKQIFYNIKDITNGYISKSKIKQLIKEI